MEPYAAPRPDSETGEPRPSSAYAPYKNQFDGQDYKYKPPPPPDGRGPVLEYYKETAAARWKLSVTIVIGVLILGSLGAWLRGYGVLTFFSHPWLLLFPVGGGSLVWIRYPGDVVTAGADWLRYRRKWVNTYDLKAIKAISGNAKAYELTDRSDRKVYVSALQLQSNTKLWDLVYNGIVHSVENGAVVKGRARACQRMLGMEPTES